jgi:hypothetical protein
MQPRCLQAAVLQQSATLVAGKPFNGRSGLEMLSGAAGFRVSSTPFDNHVFIMMKKRKLVRKEKTERGLRHSPVVVH